jgi:signal peptidase II
MKHKITFFLSTFVFLLILDQGIKYGFVFYDWKYDGPVISLILAYNYGVAFSMFAFLQEALKYVQLALLTGVAIYLYLNKEVFNAYFMPIALIFAGGVSNILDRFTYGGVVDYIFWHYKFEFAIFNFADILINIGVAFILYLTYKQHKQSSVSK